VYPEADASLGPVQLRYNEKLDFVENGAFDPSIAIYDDNYQNNQGLSKKFQNHMASVLIILKSNAHKGDKLVEVGCGKGDFFERLQADGYFDAYGYDATYEGENNRIEKRYLTEEDSLSADMVILRHVLEHIQDPYAFLKLLQSIFGHAKIYIEVPSFDWIRKNETFFDITYEHVNYFTQKTLSDMFSGKIIENGLLFDDQYQYVVANLTNLSDDFANIYHSDESWKTLSFDQLFPSLSKKITAIEETAKQKDKIYLWGAATKGCMFLIHCMLKNMVIDKVEFAVDINPQKIGKYLPITKKPIKSKDDLFATATKNDLILISNPIYKDEIVEELNKNSLDDIEVRTL
jgi:hypothetical protein